HEHPLSVQEAGHLRLTCRDGRTLEAPLFFYGKEPVLFTLQGVPCIRGGPYNTLAPGKHMYLPEVLTLQGGLRAIKKGDRAMANDDRKLLRRSAGRTERRP